MITEPPPGFRYTVPRNPDDDGFACTNGKLRIIASWGQGWDHVSASLENRCPTWDEMAWIARHFWPCETAMQLHVPKDHRNYHPYCLHWWRPQNEFIPLPPGWMVAPKRGEIIPV